MSCVGPTLPRHRDIFTEQDPKDAVSYAELHAYRRGYEDGRVDASVFNAELHCDELADRLWRDEVRDLNLDRRDEQLLARLRKQREDWLARRGPALDHRDAFVLYLAEHPGVRFHVPPPAQNVQERPHGVREVQQ